MAETNSNRETAPPNLLFIFTDQQRADSLGVADGYTRTPNLDALAARGTRYTQCVTQAPVCMPARFSLITGEYPHALGITRNGHLELEPDAPSWVRELRRLGYRTGVVGVTHYYPYFGDLESRRDTVMQLGFDHVDQVASPHGSATSQSTMTEWWKAEGVYDAFVADRRERKANRPWVVRPSPLGLERYYDRWVGRRAVDYLRSYSGTQPWFLWVGFPGPHDPWDTPEPFASSHAPEAAPAARPFPSDLRSRPQGYLDRRRAEVPPISSDEVAAMRADYAGSVELIDHEIGALLRVIEERGELDRTAIIVSSDHGELNGDAGLIYKNVFLDGAVLVPLVVAPPLGGTQLPATCDAPVELNAVGPTFLDFASGARTKEFGRVTSLLGNRARSNGARPAAPQIAISRYAGELMVTDGRHKLALNGDGLPYLLFDRDEDPFEATNRVTDPSMERTLDELRGALLERLVATINEEPCDYVHHIQFPEPPRLSQRIRGRVMREVSRIKHVARRSTTKDAR